MDRALRQQLARPLGLISSGCFIVTARHGQQSTGMLASWVQQAAFEPPLITLALRRGRPILSLIDESQHLVLNIIGDDPAGMLKHFGRGFDLKQPAFEGLPVRQLDTGVVIDSCCGYLGCRVRERISAGDHLVYLAEAVEGMADESVQPYVRIRTNGFVY